jgi:hypothetical protein
LKEVFVVVEEPAFLGNPSCSWVNSFEYLLVVIEMRTVVDQNRSKDFVEKKQEGGDTI